MQWKLEYSAKVQTIHCDLAVVVDLDCRGSGGGSGGGGGGGGRVVVVK